MLIRHLLYSTSSHSGLSSIISGGEAAAADLHMLARARKHVHHREELEDEEYIYCEAVGSIWLVDALYSGLNRKIKLK